MTERDKTCQSALGSLNQVGNVSMSERPCNSTLLGILARAHHWQFGTFDYARGKDRIGPGIWASLDRIGMGATWIDCTIKHCFIYCLSFEVVQIKENVRLEIHVWGMQGPTGDKASELKLVATYGEDCRLSNGQGRVWNWRRVSTAPCDICVILRRNHRVTVEHQPC